MDYAVRANVRRHADWAAFEDWRTAAAKRLVLLTTGGATPLPDFDFDQGDLLLFGSESAGVPPHVHAAAAARVPIPMKPGFRPLNFPVAACIELALAPHKPKRLGASFAQIPQTTRN